ncbi:dioxygenase [Microbacterium sp. HMH0099]|uniref:dioxygenase n=1 Tax=Microbacterium sp. HMH0099 TaxID=3414026 RepID=UPI003BF753A0
MATGGKDRQSREQRERARIYQARRDLHERTIRRRTRDNVLAAVIGGLVVLAAVGAQTAYFVAGPGAPAPVPSETATPAPSETPAPSDTPSPSDAPSPEATPTTAP